MSLVKQISLGLGLSEDYILKVARTASHRYKTYDIPKKTTGKRTIHHPSKELKTLQRWLLRNVIDLLPIDDNHAYAYRRKINIADHARLHSGKRFLLAMDLENFFPSIRDHDMEEYFGDHPELFPSWSSSDLSLFCSIVFRKGQLTIGAPTSPALSNALCRPLDLQLSSLCEYCHATYSRYADDLFFSTDIPDRLHLIERNVQKELDQLRYPAGLRVNSNKTWNSSKRNRRSVTGIILTSDGDISVGRTLKRQIRNQVYRLDSLPASQRTSLQGMIAWIQSVEPGFISRLIRKYGRERIERARKGGDTRSN